MGGNRRITHLVSSRVVSSRRLTAGVVRADDRVGDLGSAVTGRGTARTAGHEPRGRDRAGREADPEIATNSTRADVLDERYLKARTAVKVATQKVAATQQDIATAEEPPIASAGSCGAAPPCSTSVPGARARSTSTCRVCNSSGR